MIRKRTKAALAALSFGAMMFVAPTAARAETINVILVGVTACGANFCWEYEASQTDNARTTDGAVPGATTPLSSTEGEVADYFTIYDFVGFVGVTGDGTTTDWDFQVQNLGSTPSNVIPTDSASIENITFYYTNAAARPGPWEEQGFIIESIYGGPGVAGTYTSEDTNANSTTNQSVGSVFVPQAVPEPGSLLLLGMGLLGAAGAARRRMRK